MNQDLQGQSILITSGPTRGNIDAVRFISNRSSGRLGCAIATEALSRGADVTMVTGPDSQLPQKSDISSTEWERLNTIPVITVSDLLQTLEDELTSRPPYSAVVHAMAVLDYVPQEEKDRKVRSGKDQWTLKLTRTPKVIRRIKDWSPQSFLVGFKLEIDKDDKQLQFIATDLFNNSRSDLVVANNLNDIHDEQHPALLMGRRGNIVARPQTKSGIAQELCNALSRAL